MIEYLNYVFNSSLLLLHTRSFPRSFTFFIPLSHYDKYTFGLDTDFSFQGLIINTSLRQIPRCGFPEIGSGSWSRIGSGIDNVRSRQLPVSHRVLFKICIFVWNCITRAGPSHLQELYVFCHQLTLCVTCDPRIGLF